mmetsp:Transcript_26542/g.76413  ORF Transcript_26542/g.76413 Transcript_26542/m.76413 type:complete len:234 (-) Transcript_26542:186-887(-)
MRFRRSLGQKEALSSACGRVLGAASQRTRTSFLASNCFASPALWSCCPVPWPCSPPSSSVAGTPCWSRPTTTAAPAAPAAAGPRGARPRKERATRAALSPGRWLPCRLGLWASRAGRSAQSGASPSRSRGRRPRSPRAQAPRAPAPLISVRTAPVLRVSAQGIPRASSRRRCCKTGQTGLWLLGASTRRWPACSRRRTRRSWKVPRPYLLLFQRRRSVACSARAAAPRPPSGK